MDLVLHTTAAPPYRSVHLSEPPNADAAGGVLCVGGEDGVIPGAGQSEDALLVLPGDQRLAPHCLRHRTHRAEGKRRRRSEWLFSMIPTHRAGRKGDRMAVFDETERTALDVWG
jgi:hypothetical protein